MSNQKPAGAHITAQTVLIPAISAWKIYLDDQGRSIHTIKAFSADLNLLANHLPPDRTVGSITTQDLNLFLDWMQNQRGVPCSPKTLARRITSLKAFFRWLQKGGAVLVDPAEKVVQKSVISPLPTVLTPEEQADVFHVANLHRSVNPPEARSYTLLSLLLATGIKKGECLDISLNHIEEEEGQPSTLFIRYASPQNRYKERKIPLPMDWISAYQEYRIQYAPVDRLFPWSPRRLEYILEDIGKEAGLEKHLSFAMCRWTCALNDWQAGMEHDKIRQKLGLSKIQWREIKNKLAKLESLADSENQ